MVTPDVPMLIFLALVTATTVGSALLQARAIARLEAEGSDLAQATRSVSLFTPAAAIRYALMVTIVVAMGVTSPAPPSALGWSLQGWQWLLPMTPIAMAAAFGVKRLTTWLMRRTGTKYVSVWFQNRVLPQTRGQFALLAAIMVLVVLLEELLMRSLWIGALSRFLPLWPLVVVGALLFGLMHATQKLAGMVFATLFGLVLGLLFVGTGGLLVPLLFHYVYNMTAITLAWLARASRTVPAPEPAAA